MSIAHERLARWHADISLLPLEGRRCITELVKAIRYAVEEIPPEIVIVALTSICLENAVKIEDKEHDNTRDI